ncbi:MCE family protein [Mycobacterium sp. 663a-19]|uniref:MCE family protein n=1 Tax=Mycobacterium sp. 663a-19 TaxID=2986148 RepID=UPI002D1E9CBB|nr:MCE family protein [Mycobacterium sp. 663a-19]MEB3980123.1 MCE family protein [Mycobacterium sp. 663a-19]
MKSFSERNRTVIGVVGIAVTAAIVLGALEYDKLPIFTAQKDDYSAYFAESSGISPGAHVWVSGFQVGAVTGVELDGPRVLVKFNVDKDVRLGDRTEAAIKAKSLLGAKVLEITPRGDGHLSGPIPMNRTTPAYQLPDALGDLTQTVRGLDTDRLDESLSTLAKTFKDTPPDLKAALDGVTRFAQTLDERDSQLRNLLANANKATGVLAKRSDQVVQLIANTNALLAQLRTQSAALDQISGNISALSRQLSGFVNDNRSQLRSALDKLNGVLTIVDNRKERLQKSLKLLNAYSLSLGETVSSGPFFKAYVVNLLPGQFVQPFVDAAFSDLGLDPNVLLPSQRTDPQTGQPGTPPLPVPYPRTGQGGEPRRTLPEAITGNPGDHSCGPAGVPLPGPGCYPYREPPPAPPPGGPPPGPPAPAPPGLASTPEPTPSPVYVPAPNEAPPPKGQP